MNSTRVAANKAKGQYSDTESGGGETTAISGHILPPIDALPSWATIDQPCGLLLYTPNKEGKKREISKPIYCSPATFTTSFLCRNFGCKA